MFNRYIVVPFVVWVVTQFIKFIVAAFNGRIDPKYLYASGGMPSVHAAVVCSLAVTSLLVDGANSSIFGLTVVVAAIVMYDSFGVRRSAGEQAVAINALIEGINRSDLRHPPTRLREILGHKPLEVVVGAIMGVILGCLFNYDKLDTMIQLITTTVNPPYTYVVAAVSGLIIVLGAVMRWWLFRPYREIDLARQAAGRASWSAWLLGAVGGILAFAEYEKIVVASWIIWPGLLLVALVLTLAVLTRQYYRVLPPAIAAYEAATHKEKWLPGPNKKRRAKAARAKKR